MNSYQTNFFQNLGKSYKDQQAFFPDLTLHCAKDDSQWPCHRLILAAASEHFKDVLNCSSSNVIQMNNNISGETLTIILKYIYSGEIDLTLDNAFDVLSAANYLNLHEIVEDCVELLLQNIELNKCFHLLQLAYELDISRLINGTISFIGNNFSNIIIEKEYKKNLCLLQTKILFDLLNSDELVTRNAETGLCTRPIEREKRITEFILDFCKDSNDKTIILSLLPAVKWHIFNIFGEEDYVFEKLTPLSDMESIRELLGDFLNMKISESLSLQKNCPGSKNKSIIYTRAYSCSELVPSTPMASGGHIPNDFGCQSKSFSCIAEENECLRELIIVLRLWGDYIVVGGIGLKFSFNSETIYKHVGLEPDDGLAVEHIRLEKDEHITEVYGNSGWLINNLVFKTSKNKTYGPYGDDGGDKRHLMNTLNTYREKGGYVNSVINHAFGSIAPGPHKRLPLDSFLVGIKGKDLTTEGALTITCLSFIFRAMLPSSDFLIRNDKKCEIFITDSVREFCGDVWLLYDPDLELEWGL